MRHLLCIAIALWSLLGSALAQDPLKVAPQAYRSEFENDWVRVIRVHYGPRVKIPVHNHTEWGAAYVYLNDSAQIIFKHIGPDSGAATRPPTKAGSFRLYKAIKEVHEVENPTDTPSDFLRVEFKTEVAGEQTLRGRYYREAHPVGENYHKVQFENEQIRITRLVCAPGKTVDVSGTSIEAALLVALTPMRLRTSGQKGVATPLNMRLGQTRWLAGGQQERLKNLSSQPAEFLRFEFKTKPTSSKEKVTRIRVIANDNFEFIPTTVTVTKGVPVELELISKDSYRKHGFNLPAFGVRVDMNPGSVNRLRFTPDKAGTFTFACDVFCCDGHREMKGSLVVIDQRETLQGE